MCITHSDFQWAHIRIPESYFTFSPFSVSPHYCSSPVLIPDYKIYIYGIIANLWACILRRKAKGGCRQPPRWEPSWAIPKLTPFLPLFSVSELPCQGRMPSNKHNFGCWKKNRIQHKADGGKQQSAFGQPNQGTQALFQSPPTLERSESLNCSLFYQTCQPHTSSYNEFSDPLTFSWFLLSIHNSLQNQAKPPCSDS